MENFYSLFLKNCFNQKKIYDSWLVINLAKLKIERVDKDENRPI